MSRINLSQTHDHTPPKCREGLEEQRHPCHRHSPAPSCGHGTRGLVCSGRPKLSRFVGSARRIHAANRSPQYHECGEKRLRTLAHSSGLWPRYAPSIRSDGLLCSDIQLVALQFPKDSVADFIRDAMVPEMYGLEQWRVRAIQTGYDLCKLAALPEVSRSVRSLERLFKRNFSATPSHYLKLWRVEDACAYITSTGASNKEAAANFGFYDEAHLCHVVKQMFARTPQSYLLHFTRIETSTNPKTPH